MADNGTILMTIRIDDTKCNYCMECIEACPVDALSLDKSTFYHDPDKCARDEICIDVCSEKAIEILWGRT